MIIKNSEAKSKWRENSTSSIASIQKSKHETSEQKKKPKILQQSHWTNINKKVTENIATGIVNRSRTNTDAKASQLLHQKLTTQRFKESNY